MCADEVDMSDHKVSIFCRFIDISNLSKRKIDNTGDAGR